MADGGLAEQWRLALAGDPAVLEGRLSAESRLPGPRANLELAHRLADLAGEAAPEHIRAALHLLRSWLRPLPESDESDLSDAHREYLAAVAALAIGAILAATPDPDAAAALTGAASDPRWRVRELAATGLQRVLSADWDRGLSDARDWLRRGPLGARAAVAAVAEPPLLRIPGRALTACSIVEQGVDALLAFPQSARRDPDVRVLRQALGYAVSVVAAADPDAGVPLLERLATSADDDARWVARQNLKKARLAPLGERLTVTREALSRS